MEGSEGQPEPPTTEIIREVFDALDSLERNVKKCASKSGKSVLIDLIVQLGGNVPRRSLSDASLNPGEGSRTTADERPIGAE